LIFNRSIVPALGGGGARGFAHIGVLRIFERESIGVKAIAGTSMGAIIGALYAQHPDSFVVEQKIKTFLQSSMFKNSQDSLSAHKGPGSFLEQVANHLCEHVRNADKMRERIQLMDQQMQQSLQEILEPMDIRDTTLPFAAVATDLITGKEVVMRKGPIIQAVLASSAMPGILSPVEMDGYRLTDGAATSSVPVRTAKRLASRHKVVAVDVSSSLSHHPPLDNALSIILRTSAITGTCYKNELLKQADIVIQPQVKLFSWAEFSNIEDFIAEGEQAAIKSLLKIKKALR